MSKCFLDDANSGDPWTTLGSRLVAAMSALEPYLALCPALPLTVRPWMGFLYPVLFLKWE